MNRILIALVLCAAALQAPALRAQDKPSPPEVTFQVEVNYVDVDVVVTDDQGNFVTGLARDDFEVFEDGKPQKVDTFSYVEIPVERQTHSSSAIERSRPIRKSNRLPFAGRLFVIVLDDQDVSLDANARR